MLFQSTLESWAKKISTISFLRRNKVLLLSLPKLDSWYLILRVYSNNLYATNHNTPLQLNYFIFLCNQSDRFQSFHWVLENIYFVNSNFFDAVTELVLDSATSTHYVCSSSFKFTMSSWLAHDRFCILQQICFKDVEGNTEAYRYLVGNGRGGTDETILTRYSKFHCNAEKRPNPPQFRAIADELSMLNQLRKT